MSSSGLFLFVDDDDWIRVFTATIRAWIRCNLLTIRMVVRPESPHQHWKLLLNVEVEPSIKWTFRIYSNLPISTNQWITIVIFRHDGWC